MNIARVKLWRGLSLTYTEQNIGLNDKIETRKIRFFCVIADPALVLVVHRGSWLAPDVLVAMGILNRFRVRSDPCAFERGTGWETIELQELLKRWQT